MPSSLAFSRYQRARELVAALHRLDERLDRLVARLVGEVARRDPRGVGAQAVVDGLVERERVDDERAGAQAGLERGGDLLGGLPAHLAVGRHEAAERDLERLVVDLDAGHELGEQARPGASEPVWPFSAMSFSSASESRCGR